MNDFTPRPVPELGPPRKGRAPSVAERTLDSGLRVLAVRRSGAPLVELRLRVPFAASSRAAADHLATSSLLAETALSGTERHSNAELAAALQALGGGLAAAVNADRLLVSGNALATGLSGILGLLAEVLTTASYPKSEVDGEKDRLVERIQIARSQPSVVAREALARRLFGDHPYGRDLPSEQEIRDLTAAKVRSLHRRKVVPAGSVLVLVGDLTPARALDAVEAALAGWTTEGAATEPPPVPPIEPGPVTLVHRPGAVQSNLRLGGLALTRSDPDYPALQLANMVFGGYFSSRLVENIREDKGYTYSPHALIDHSTAGSNLLVEADVATEVTGPALLEVLYELGRVSLLPVGEEELENARQYAIGSLQLSTATQAGLATMITSLVAGGLDLDWLREHPGRLAKVTIDEVGAQAARFLAPSSLATVVVGDAEQVEGALRALGPVERA
ncbi:MAG: M16 family metallopeptidase [Mycobacteriales bacterium]